MFKKIKNILLLMLPFFIATSSNLISMEQRHVPGVVDQYAMRDNAACLREIDSYLGNAEFKSQMYQLNDPIFHNLGGRNFVEISGRDGERIFRTQIVDRQNRCGRIEVVFDSIDGMLQMKKFTAGIADDSQRRDPAKPGNLPGSYICSKDLAFQSGTTGNFKIGVGFGPTSQRRIVPGAHHNDLKAPWQFLVEDPLRKTKNWVAGLFKKTFDDSSGNGEAASGNLEGPGADDEVADDITATDPIVDDTPIVGTPLVPDHPVLDQKTPAELARLKRELEILKEKARRQEPLKKRAKTVTEKAAEVGKAALMGGLHNAAQFASSRAVDAAFDWYEGKDQYSGPVQSRFTSFLSQPDPHPFPFQSPVQQQPPIFMDGYTPPMQPGGPVTTTTTTTGNIAPEDVGMEGMEYTPRTRPEISADIRSANAEALKIQYAYLNTQYKEYAQRVCEISKELNGLARLCNVMENPLGAEDMLHLSKSLLRAQEYFLSISAEYAKGFAAESIKDGAAFVELFAHPINALQGVGLQATLATLLTGALVFDDNESLDFGNSQAKEALFRHYKDKITTKIDEVVTSFANSTDQQNARKIGGFFGSICTNLILAKGTAIVTEEIIGTIAKVAENFTYILKGETEFVATLADLEPSVKKTLTPFTTSLEEASDIAEQAHLRPSPGYRPPEPHSSTPVFGKDFGIKMNTHRQFNPAIIYGREYSGHALQRMTERGLTPMTIENAIKNGITRANKVSGRLEHLDSVNRVIAITCEKTGRVITLRFGS